MSPPTCEDCSNCLLMDFGYSNYTVEGTTVVCMVGAHPNKEFDRFYGVDERLKFAEQCDKYTPGEPDALDVDGEDWDGLSEQAKSFINEEAPHHAPYGK
jgi:hypothetical protein